ncbi:SusC/RagA family TonB-linked outer membrane protein [Spirosoma taeanense]|uniref:SusC/RagA family TonB-linked outer membrane protein n=1 Tax=Spirosoma taeanense TaxID=2735870 RepID=A0A6M5YCK8_9BACT|nr:SusC/RagA family TonB-linked outer membrane protein [Spirosoma taeanense]QJW91010.1 SusC/RagA family TonB-linked outer membrane protein [Spirosoma taeanense]
MKNQYITFSMLLVGVGVYAIPQLSAAQLLTRAQTKSESSTDRQPARLADRSHSNRSVKKALAELEKRFNINFAYDEQLLAGRNTEADFTGLSLEQALTHLVDSQGLGYRQVNNKLFVIQASGAAQQVSKNLAAGNALPAMGTPAGESAVPSAEAPQVRRITGQVTDENGQGLPGANVIEKGTSTGTTTDATGNFVLNVSDGATTLTVSSVGYLRQDVAIGNQTVINVQLAPDNRTLDEVVVVSYGTQKRSNLTEAVSIVNTAEAKKVQAASVVDQIQGRAAGVTVASTGGAPGSTASIKIRGSSTFGSNQDPIYIIDGVIIGSASSDFNPNDIETVTILKDAAATALYGSRGMNGAIVITTKRGKAGKPTIEYNGYYGVQNIARRLPLASRDQYIRTWTAAYQNGNLAVPDFGAGGYNTDWQEELIKPGAITDHNVSISGGIDNGANKSNYRISGGYFSQDGTIRGRKPDGTEVSPYFKRYSARVNAGTTRGKLTISESAYLAYTNERRVIGQPFDNVIRMPPTIPVFDPNNLSGYGYGSANNATFGTNPIGQQAKDDNLVNSYKLLGNIYGEYAILPWLTYRLSVGLDFSNYQNKYFTRPGALSYNSPSAPNGILDDRNGRFFNTLIENTVNANKTFGRHQISLLLGYTRQRFDQNEIYSHTEGIVGEFYQQGAGTASPRTDGFSRISGIVSYLGRINYTYDDRYNIQANLRRDASSNFPKDNQVAYFPSVSAAWNINKEAFMQNNPVIGDLRLRASYGSVGNQAIDPYSLDPTIQPNLNYVLGGGNVIVAGAANRQLQNSNLKWESKTTTDVGVDATFLNGKIQLQADYFYSLSKNLLLRVPLPITAGNQGDNPYDNLGKIENKGFELSLTYQDKKGDFRYSLNGQLTSIRNKVLQLVPSNGNQPLYGYGQITRTAVGGSLASFYVLRQNGIFQTQAEIDAGPKQPNVTPGDVRYVDTNGDGTINNDDRQIVGTPFPKLEYGANISLSYKSFDLTLFFQGVSGNVLFNRSRNWTDRFDDVQNVRSDVTFWTGPGSSNTTPKPIKGDQTLNPAFNTDRWVESGAYGRLRTAQLAYNFSSAMLNRLKMGSARVYVNAQNLFTITNYSGYNPDVVGDVGSGQQNQSNFIGRGIDQGNYPVPRVISAGLQLSF